MNGQDSDVSVLLFGRLCPVTIQMAEQAKGANCTLSLYPVLDPSRALSTILEATL